MPSQRQIRVANRLREEISRVLLREVEDPLVALVTITDVSVSPDLKHARVFFSVMATDVDHADVLKGLRRARKFIQRRIAEQGDLRFTPHLDFRFDPTAEQAQRIEDILYRLRDSGQLDDDPEEEPDDDAGALDDL